MNKINSYPKYKNHNQEWLGDLPYHWQVMRTKLLFNLITDPAPIGNSEELLSIYTALGVRPRKELEDRGNKASTTDNYWIVKTGDIIVNKLLAWMGAIGISEYNGVTSPAYDILRAKENVNPYFYHYLFRNPIASKEFKRHSRGIMDMRLRLYFTRFGDIKLPLPPKQEQTTIANFLDYKLEKIDRFITKKKQLITLLNEQKTAIINQAVTKGLNPNAKMKASGIEWLGDIPEYWKYSKLKKIANFRRGSFPQPYGLAKWYDDENGFPFIQVFDVGDNMKLKSTTKRKISLEATKKSVFIKKGTLILTIQGSIGRLAITDYDAYIDRTLLIFQSFNIPINIDYFKNVVAILFEFEEKKAIGSTIKTINKEKLSSFILPIPPISEQIQIANFIEAETTKIAKTISTIEKEISLVEEYKTALIAEAVTGKIDVRDFKIPNQETPLAMVAEEAEKYSKEN